MDIAIKIRGTDGKLHQYEAHGVSFAEVRDVIGMAIKSSGVDNERDNTDKGGNRKAGRQAVPPASACARG
jgi:hypothetical protein